MKTNFKSTINKIFNISKENHEPMIERDTIQPSTVLKDKECFQTLLKGDKEFTSLTTKVEKTMIAQNVQIVGNIHVDGDIDILGSVQGNITSTGIMHVNGSVLGNIEASGITIKNATTSGDTIKTTHDMIIDHSNVTASIQGENIEINGDIKGHIQASKLVTLKNETLLVGNITAGSITISEGAKIEGIIKTKR